MIYLLGTAAVIGLFHTLLGPDHYLPFIAMTKARRWSTARTALVTISTMPAVVMPATLGLNFLPAGRMQRYSHALTDAVIFLCGVAIHMGL